MVASYDPEEQLRLPLWTPSTNVAPLRTPYMSPLPLSHLNVKAHNVILIHLFFCIIPVHAWTTFHSNFCHLLYLIRCHVYEPRYLIKVASLIKNFMLIRKPIQYMLFNLEN